MSTSKPLLIIDPRSRFAITDIFGSDIDIDENSETFGRQVLPRMHIECRFCGAYLFPAELNHLGDCRICCSNGKVKLPPLPSLPPSLQQLYDKRAFREELRAYNAAFCFASLGVDIVNNRDGSGPACFAVQGGIYHRIGDLLPKEGEEPIYAQIYVLDPKAPSQRRSDIFHGLDSSTISAK